MHSRTDQLSQRPLVYSSSVQTLSHCQAWSDGPTAAYACRLKTLPQSEDDGHRATLDACSCDLLPNRANVACAGVRAQLREPNIVLPVPPGCSWPCAGRGRAEHLLVRRPLREPVRPCRCSSTRPATARTHMAPTTRDVVARLGCMCRCMSIVATYLFSGRNSNDYLPTSHAAMCLQIC